jgi:hypothetical protein
VPLRRQLGTRQRAVTFAVLRGPGDERLDWVRAGEALSAAWLVAAEMQISVLPLSAPIERMSARDALQSTVGHLFHPHLVIRLGRHADNPVIPGTPRLSLDQILQVRAAGTT